MKPIILNSLRNIFKLNYFSSIVLVLSALIAFVLANGPLSSIYFNILSFKIFHLTFQHWINDGLMVVFFFLVGLEIKLEITHGELSSFKKAMFPVICAVGGMVTPALFYLALNPDMPELRGWGIPMATDIAFAIGVITFFGNLVPSTVKVLLLAIAIVDDLGAILAIAFFYTEQIRGLGIVIACVGVGLIFLIRTVGISLYRYYILLGILVWFGILYSGIHATIAGVILGILTPTTFKQKNSKHENLKPVDNLIHRIHPWVSYLIMPIFAFANAGVNLSKVDFLYVLSNPVYLGIVVGLVIGKPLGILIFGFSAFKFKLITLPTKSTWSHIMSIGFLAGIGFTMSLFISSLALPQDLELFSKAGIITASLISGILGYATMRHAVKLNGNPK